jgi:hypothetical protein
MPSIQSLLKSKTLWFSVLLAVLSVVQGYIVKLPLDPTDQMYLGSAVAACITILRALTTEPLADK